MVDGLELIGIGIEALYAPSSESPARRNRCPLSKVEGVVGAEGELAALTAPGSLSSLVCQRTMSKAEGAGEAEGEPAALNGPGVFSLPVWQSRLRRPSLAEIGLVAL